MEKINIFELDIDTDAIVKRTAELKKQSESLKDSLDKLKGTAYENSEEYVKMEARYKAVRSEYNSSQRELSKLITLQSKEIKTVEQGRNALSVINKEWAKQADLYGENSVEVEKLSQKKLELTERLKELESATGDNTRNVGNYTESIKDAFGNLNIFEGGLGNLKTSLGGAAQGFVGMTKSAVAFIATPIGALLAVLVGAFLLVKNAMNRSEDATNKIKKAFSAFKGITDALLKFLEPLGTFLIDGLVKGFESAEKAVYKGLETISKGLKLLGFDDAAASLDTFNGKIQEAAKNSKALADAEAALQKRQREAQKIQLEYQKRAEKLRQIRDDETRSTQERIFANEELGKVLKNQLQDELAIAQLALKAANLRIEAEGKTREALDAQAEALTNIADIQERITGQESEQLTERVALQKEAADKAKEIADQAIQEQEAQLQLFLEQQGIRAKSMQEQLNIAKEVYNRELKILEADLKNRNITQTEYEAESLRLKNEYLEKQTQATIENAQTELDEYIKGHQSKLDADQYFSEEALKLEEQRLNAIAEKRREFAAIQLEEGAVNQQEYNAAINAINEENRLAIEEAQAQRKESENEKRIVDLDNERALNEERLNYDLDYALQQYEIGYQQRKEAAMKAGADITLFEKREAENRKAIERTVQDNKLDLASSTFGNLATIAGKESAAGKAFAIAQTTIDTYKAATAAYSAMAGIPVVGPALGAVAAAAAVASGIANVKKITSTKTPKAEQGALFDIGGKRHYAGGTKFYGEDGTEFEAEKGELIGVMNRRAALAFKAFNDEYATTSSRRNYLAGGGFVQTSSMSSKYTPLNNINNFTVDYDLMTMAFTKALVNMPTPVTDVKDVINSVNNYNSVVDGANI